MVVWSFTAAAAATVMTAALSGATRRTPWRRLVEPFGIALLFTASIVPLAAFIMPRVMPFVRRRVVFPLDWGAIFVVMIAILQIMAGAEGLEPTTLGFGDRCSTN